MGVVTPNGVVGIIKEVLNTLALSFNTTWKIQNKCSITNISLLWLFRMERWNYQNAVVNDIPRM